jgi:pyruvate formate-lyase/glycerol dehydratase family glycyl radical enzyme
MVIKDVANIKSKRLQMLKLRPSELGSTERVGKLIDRLFSERPKVCLHRARAYTEVFSNTEGEPTEIRFAKAFAKALRDLPPVIREGELIVGTPYCKIRGAAISPESDGGWMKDEIDDVAVRKWDPYEITPEEVQEFKEMMHYWEGKTMLDLWRKACPEKIVNKVIGKGWADSIFGAITYGGIHFTPPYEEILSKGFSWYEQKVRKALANIDQTDPTKMGRHHLYEALLISCEAVKKNCKKYSEKALELSVLEKDLKRKEELVKIADVINRVPYYGARSFYEAIQSVWFVNVLYNIESCALMLALGRFDQYMYPYYKSDLEKGILTRDQAQELIECLYVKINGNCKVPSSEGARSSPGYDLNQTICLGGVDRMGKDATNDLSYLCLEAAGSLRTINPDIAILCHPRETPYALKMKAVELNGLGMGVPKFANTETIKIGLMNFGYSPEESTIGWMHGCSEIYGPGCKQYGHTMAGNCNAPLALEAVLFSGRKRMPGQPGSGELLGLETGDCRQFKNFGEFLKAVKAQLSQQILDAHIATSWEQWVQARYFPHIMESLVMDSCVERGLPAQAGGAIINVGPGIAITGGLATLVDSLAAVKKLVYEEKRFSMDKLIKAIDANFDGYETIQKTLINHAPKFGNDIDYVDDLAREIFNFITDEVARYTMPLGNKNTAMIAYPMSNIMEGARTWASPDGRKAGMPLSHHLGPTDGLDINGPIANIKSATKLAQERHNGCTHNLYLVNVDSDEQLRRMVDLIDLYFNRGGHHLQFNCQDKVVFIDAQKRPEKYPSLMVRVAGYVAYFVELPKELQDQIIARTSQYV